MATAPNIILKNKEILLTQGSSISGIQLDNSPFLFGTVELVCELTDAYSVLDSVVFDPTNATIIKYGGVDFFLVKESDVKPQEQAAP